MASCSEHSLNDTAGVWHLGTIDAQEATPRLGQQRRIDPSDIREWGALFSELEDSYPAQLDSRDVEDTAALDQPQAEAGPSAAHRMPSPGPMPVRGTAASMPPLSPVMEYLNANPYLPLSELPEFHRQRSARTVGALGAQSSSSQSTKSSEYLSAKDYSAWSNTESTHDGGTDGSTHSPLERQLTPYFTPSHTPSHRSEETATEEIEEEGRAPDSPHPRSNFYPYDARYGLTAVERVN